MTLDQIADRLDPTKVYCFLPFQGVTHCNDFTHCFMAALGVDFAPPGLTANQQHDWMKKNWRQVGVASACDAANLNRPAVACYFNPTGHGHIAPLLPGSTPSSPAVCAAGARNYRRCPLVASFGAVAVDFFTP